MFGNKVSRHWAGFADASAVTFDVCYTSWVTNPARLKPVATSASSESAGSEAQKATNGFLGSDISHCFSSTAETGPWWMADLGESKTISQVRVHTRQDGVSSDFLSVEARLGDSSVHDSNPEFGVNAGTPHVAAEVVFAPSEAMSGRYLSMKSLDGAAGPLTICDVEILEEHNDALKKK
ncbi:uncharacterized protein LOC122248047 [Penaeus japonicus]|uniref:uncharacterized protein LOC122248047 n=1 Tax=Penaeus japonicus TaxID=27405 RepID=UPI001C714A55|nr:uncharacterized protein LOC122248047 [Penaeus japonicus]